MADVIPFRSQFDLDAERAVAAALSGNDAKPDCETKAAFRARRARLGLGYKPQAMPADSDTRPSELA